MASGDDFWEKSDVKGYNFDDDEVIFQTFSDFLKKIWLYICLYFW